MLVLLAFIIVFHITSAALLFVATIDNVSCGVLTAGAYTNLTYKIRVDGYKITCWVKGSNKVGTISNWESDEWVLSYDINALDLIKANSNTSSGQNSIYALTDNCHFGITARFDVYNLNGSSQPYTKYNYSLPYFDDIWFNIIER